MNPLEPAVLPEGIRATMVPDVNGLTMHVLEAGFATKHRPCVLLLHGFPELAFSWRKIMVPLARAGYHVIAPDQRGYGRTVGWDPDYDGDVASFRLLNLVRDALELVARLGHRSVAAVVGHDFGSPVAAWCALIRPDIFKSAALMSAPFAGASPLPPADDATGSDPTAALAALTPPRKHYQWYYSTRAANADMRQAPEGLHAFLRAYFHVKSADWPNNHPSPLRAWTADELARLPRYYVMDADKTMPETVASEMPSSAAIAQCRWLPEDELAVYSAEYARTGFQGGLQWYRCRTEPGRNADLRVFAGRTIDVPTIFIGGKSDWGVYQVPGGLSQMQQSACTRFRACHLIDGAGHWVQQEQPAAVAQILREFLGSP